MRYNNNNNNNRARFKLAVRVLGDYPQGLDFAVFGHFTFRSAMPGDLKCHFD